MKIKIDKKSVGLRIKQIRMNKGYTLEEFGKLFNTSKSNVSMWERGKSIPGVERMKSIAKFSDITVHELLHGSIEEYSKIQALEKLEEYLVKIKKLSTIAGIDFADHYEAMYNQWRLEYGRERMKDNDRK